MIFEVKNLNGEKGYLMLYYRVNLKEKKQQTNVKIVAKMFPQGSITAWKNSVFNSSYLFILNTYLCRLQ